MKNLISDISFVLNVIVRALIPPYNRSRLEKYCKARIEKHPEAFQPRSLLAYIYTHQEMYEKAEKEYAELRRRGLLRRRGYSDYAYVLFKLKDYQGVVDLLAPVVDKETKDKNSFWFLGVSLMELNDYCKAAYYLESLINLGRPRYEDYFELGMCYYQNGEYGDAFAYFALSSELKPESKESRRKMALVLIEKGKLLMDSDIESAEEEFRRALEVSPSDSLATRLLENAQEIKRIDKNIREASRDEIG